MRTTGRLLRQFSRDRSGVVAVITAVSLPVFIGFSALAIDLSYAYWIRNQLQIAADSSALAGVSQVQLDEATVKAEAIIFAQFNMANSRHGNVLDANDIVIGHWDMPSRTFTPTGITAAQGTACSNPIPLEANPNCLPLNAVMTSTRRANANSNPLVLFFAGALGLVQTDINTTAIAWSTGGGAEDDCFNNGFVAGNWAFSGSENLFSDFCVHGEEGVHAGSQNYFGDDSEISTPTIPEDIESGSDNTGLDDALKEKSLQPQLANTVSDLINGLPGDYPEYINNYSTSLPEFDNGPGTEWGVPGTAYVINGKVDIPSDRNLNNIVIIADGDISIGSYSQIKNTVLAAKPGDGLGRVQIGSFGIIGDDAYCTSGVGSVEILAIENVLIGSNTSYNGGQLIAGHDVDLGSNLISNAGLSAQAVNDIKVGSQHDLTGCPATSNRFQTDTGGGGGTFRLVM